MEDGGFLKPQRAMSFLPFRSCRLCQTLSWPRRRSPCWTRRWQSRTLGSSWWRDCPSPCNSAQGATEPSSPPRWLKNFCKGPNRCGSGNSTPWGGVTYRGGHTTGRVTHQGETLCVSEPRGGLGSHTGGFIHWVGSCPEHVTHTHQVRSHTSWGHIAGEVAHLVESPVWGGGPTKEWACTLGVPQLLLFFFNFIGL